MYLQPPPQVSIKHAGTNTNANNQLLYIPKMGSEKKCYRKWEQFINIAV